MTILEDNESLHKLPVGLAIRLILDDVAYSNALPNWFDVIYIDYSRREDVIRQKLKAYLGGASPQPCFAIPVPRKSGKKKIWTIPSVNDQIVLQACILSFAERLDAECLDERVFSCRYNYNRQPDQLVFIEDQIAAWTRFQDKTKRRCAGGDCLLQLDLDSAFNSIDRSRLYDFLSHFSPAPVLGVLKRLLESFAFESGLPSVSNSIFFLGNAYLSEVDKIIHKNAPDFIRYVDDYRIFAESKASLEASLRRIARDLEKIGFRINSEKLRVGEGLEYLDAISKVKYSLSDDGAYASPAIVRDLMRGPDIASAILNTVNDPNRYLNDGWGRFQLAVIRKYRFNLEIGSVVKPAAEPPSLTTELSENVKLARRFLELLKGYSADPNEAWRTIWLLYVAKSFDFDLMNDKDTQTSTQLQAALENIRSSPRVSAVTRLWADKNAGAVVEGDDVNALHDLSYVASGQTHCKGCVT